MFGRDTSESQEVMALIPPIRSDSLDGGEFIDRWFPRAMDNRYFGMVFKTPGVGRGVAAVGDSTSPRPICRDKAEGRVAEGGKWEVVAPQGQRRRQGRTPRSRAGGIAVGRQGTVRQPARPRAIARPTCVPVRAWCGTRRPSHETDPATSGIINCVPQRDALGNANCGRVSGRACGT